jgi:hypothetical protein
LNFVIRLQSVSSSVCFKCALSDRQIIHIVVGRFLEEEAKTLQMVNAKISNQLHYLQVGLAIVCAERNYSLLFARSVELQEFQRL